MSTVPGVGAMPAEYPFVLVVDEQNDFAFYYSGTMDQDAMSKSLINLECIMKEDVAIVFDHMLRLYRLSSLKSASSLAGNRYEILCRTTYEVNHGVVSNPDKTSDNEDNIIGAAGLDATAVGNKMAAKVRIPRPRNRWIIYRQYRSRQLHEEDASLTAGEISTLVSKMWHSETPEVKEHFKHLAEEEGRQHKKKYPQYKYEARKSATNKRKYQGDSD